MDAGHPRRAREGMAGAGLLDFRVDRFLVIWAGVVVLFFSASHSKATGYVLPALPAILLLFCQTLSGHVRQRAPRAGASLPSRAESPWRFLAGALPALSARPVVDGIRPGNIRSGCLPRRWRHRRRASPRSVFCAERAAKHPSRFSEWGASLPPQLALSGTHVLDENYSSER